MGSTNVESLSAGWRPAPNATDQLHWKVTVTNAAVRLGALIVAAGGTGIPLLTIPGDINNQARPPRHVVFTVPVAALNPVYMSWDNNTAPVVGGPGHEIPPGMNKEFELGGEAQLATKTGVYAVANGSVFQFIATANTALLVDFAD